MKYFHILSFNPYIHIQSIQWGNEVCETSKESINIHILRAKKGKVRYVKIQK